MKHIYDYDLFEKIKTNSGNTYGIGDIVVVTYGENTELVPVKIIKKYGKNKYGISYNVEGSPINGAPDDIVTAGDIVSVLKGIDDPAEKPMVNHRSQEPISNDMVTGVL